jgi:hypothetical protein
MLRGFPLGIDPRRNTMDIKVAFDVNELVSIALNTNTTDDTRSRIINALADQIFQLANGRIPLTLRPLLSPLVIRM